MQSFIIVFSTLLCTSLVNFASGTIVNACDGILKPDNIEISNCAQQPCDLIPGTSLTMNFTFISPALYENIKPNVVATALGIHIPYPVGDDACKDIINTPCPIAEDEFIQYNFNFDLMKGIPAIAVNVRFSLTDKDTNTEFICFNVDLQVKG